MIRDERAATSPISYSLTIAIATILVTGLVVAGSGHVSDQRSTAARAQMDVVAQQVAGNIEAADRLVRSTESPPSTLNLERRLPKQILGAEYIVEIDGPSDGTGTVIVRSSISDRHVSAEYYIGEEMDVTVDTGNQFDGEIIEIRYTDPGSPDHGLEVTNVDG